MGTPFAPVEVFYSFAEVDAPLLEQVEHHLSMLRHAGLITTWNRRQIVVGSDWQVELDQHLNTASLILLLISPDFIASDYCYSIEMQRALERHERGEARVIPIILRRVDWQDVLGKLQALPTDARPIKSWPDLDEALYNVTEGIRIVIQETTAKSSPPPPILSTRSVSQTPLPTNLPYKSQKAKEQWLEEGNRFGDLKQYSEALAAYEQAIRLDPNDAVAFATKGYALYELKRFEEALAACEQAIRLDPNYAVAYQNKGKALNGLNREEEAQWAKEKASQLGYSG